MKRLWPWKVYSTPCIQAPRGELAWSQRRNHRSTPTLTSSTDALESKWNSTSQSLIHLQSTGWQVLSKFYSDKTDRNFQEKHRKTTKNFKLFLVTNAKNMPTETNFAYLHVPIFVQNVCATKWYILAENKCLFELIFFIIVTLQLALCSIYGKTLFIPYELLLTRVLTQRKPRYTRG